MWQAPQEVNRTPVGGQPSGQWSYAGTQPDGLDTAAPDGTSAAQDADVAAPGLGAQDFYGFEEFEVLGADSLAVNLANGNLVVRSEDLAINGPGIGLSIERFYNSLAQRSGALGAGWSLTAGQDVGLEIEEEEEVTFRAPSGFRATFALDGEEWIAPSGLNAELEATAEGQWELTYNRTDETQVFSAGGYLLASVERNGNTLEYHYDGDDRLVSITDAAGRVTTLDYGDGDLLTAITDPADREINYTYDDAGRLTEYQIPTGSASPRAQFDYDDDDRLVSISAGSGAEGWETSIELAYDDEGRVSDVVQHNGDQGTSQWSLSYETGQTAVTDPARPDRGHGSRWGAEQL